MALNLQWLLPSEDEILLESARKFYRNRCFDSLLFTGCDILGKKILLFLVRRKTYIQSSVFLYLNSKDIYFYDEKHISNTNDWHSECIKFECSEPMKTWRISFNGLLKKIDDENEHVKLNFLWHPISSVVYYDKHGHASISPINKTHFDEDLIYNLLQGYEQWGTLHGIAQINQQTVELNLNSLKKRSWILHKKDLRTYIFFVNNGMLINVNSVLNSSFGHSRTLKKHFCITDCDLLYPFQMSPTIFFQMSDGKFWYRVKTEISMDSIINFENFQICNSSATVNDKNAEGLFFCFKRYEKLEQDQNLYILPPLKFSSNISINLWSAECQNHEYVGGKAAGLAKMMYFLERDLIKNSEGIDIPNGICITVKGMELCIRQNENLMNILNLLKYGIHEVPTTQLNLLCKRIQKQWLLINLNSEIIDPIADYINEKKFYAIRSSSVYEDTIEGSAAGQTKTFLYVKGLENILQALKDCWSSAFSFESIQFRRINGMPLMAKMGVIIQEMVPKKLNGVLFTCDPSNNDTNTISLTCSCKEQVTEGKGNSFTFLLDKTNLFIKNQINLGYEGINISDQHIRKLCQISLELEDLFSYPINLEWAIDEDIYLLQCRPVTTIFTWTDFEISHELDSGFTEFDAVTFHNCGEIAADITSPLSITFNNRIMEDAFCFVDKDPSVAYHKKLLSVAQYRIAMNICNGLLLQVKKKIPFFQKVIDVIICGQVITTENLYLLAQKRNGITNFFTTFKKLVSVVKLLLTKNQLTEKAIKLASEFKINTEEFNSADLLLQTIINQAEVLKEAAEIHLNVTSACNILKAAILCSICDKEDDLQNKVTNLSWVLSNCPEIVSADVPKSLTEIANILRQHSNKMDYLSTPVKYKCDWMQKNCNEAWIKTKIFFENHGYRCFKEADLMTQTWSMCPDPIFKCIDSLIMFNRSELLQNSMEVEVPENFSITSYERRIRWLMGSCKKTVVNRERTKQCFILVLHQFRLAFQKLGNLLAKDVVIKDPKFVYFYTFYELFQLVKGKDRKCIVHKGQRRYRLWNHLKTLKFDDVIFGLPLPTSPELEITPENQVHIYRGTSVSFHDVIGKARVLQNINEVEKIQPGDILVTRCIDIGWSPYFPLLSGLITELGGLMSHGAIIARECGLPCVTGVKNITSLIRTGDTVKIHGCSGVITKDI